MDLLMDLKDKGGDLMKLIVTLIKVVGLMFSGAVIYEMCRQTVEENDIVVTEF